MTPKLIYIFGFVKICFFKCISKTFLSTFTLKVPNFNWILFVNCSKIFSLLPQLQLGVLRKSRKEILWGYKSRWVCDGKIISDSLCLGTKSGTPLLETIFMECPQSSVHFWLHHYHIHLWKINAFHFAFHSSKFCDVIQLIFMCKLNYLVSLLQIGMFTIFFMLFDY